MCPKRSAVAALSLVTLLAPARGFAAADRFAEIRKQVEARHDAAVELLRSWIALPSIAAENLNVDEGARRMAELARDAGFQKAEIVPTDGKPGVFATLDVGAPKTLGVYFMYDVKQFDPAEWSSPPLEGRDRRQAGRRPRDHGPRRGEPERPGGRASSPRCTRCAPPAASCR